MRNIFAWIMITIFALLLSYTFWAFILYELDPKKWGDVPRIFFIGLAAWFVYVFKTKDIQ